MKTHDHSGREQGLSKQLRICEWQITTIPLLHHVRFSCIAWSVQSALPLHRAKYHLTIYYYPPLLLTRFNVVVITILPAFLIWFTPGAAWFHHGLIPDPYGSFASVDARTRMAIWQLGNCALHSLCFCPVLTFACHRLSTTRNVVIPGLSSDKRCAPR